MAIRDEMRAVVDAMGAPKPPLKRFVLIGHDAMPAFEAASLQEDDRTGTLDGIPVVGTDEFSGWEIVDKPSRVDLTQFGGRK